MAVPLRLAVSGACPIALAALLWLATTGAEAAQRTFVASYGNDASACSLNAPCRSFAAAMNHTDSAGEIIVLDSAGYGIVTINRSLSITAPPGVYAGISVFAGETGIEIAAAGIVVKLRGLTINGQGGELGISFVTGARLYIQQCVVSGIANRGINLQTGETYVSDSTIRENGYGIRADGALQLAVDRTRIESSISNGIYATNGPAITVTNSVLVGNANAIQLINDDGVGETSVNVTDSNLSHNSGGIDADSEGGAGSLVRVFAARNTIGSNSSEGVTLRGSVGKLVGTVTENTIVRNNRGIDVSGANASVTVAANTVSGNTTSGIRQLTGALVRTRSSSVVQDNPTDVSGTLTFVAGD